MDRKPGFNPFFIRASVYCAPLALALARLELRFQSLLHQGISLLFAEASLLRRIWKFRFNPFFIRASVYWEKISSTLDWSSFPFQSLLHQGISLLLAVGQAHEPENVSVSIPSSSGHQFTALVQQCLSFGGSFCFNPFFIRASVYCLKLSAAEYAVHYLFQSLLHQGISLLWA